MRDVRHVQRAGNASLTRVPLMCRVAVCILGILSGCTAPTPEQRAAEAEALFDDTVAHYHLPSAEAAGAARTELLAQAAGGYQMLLRTYAGEKQYASQAMRSLANVRVEQGRTDAAVKLYRKVGTTYPTYNWEVIQSWKSAADLLWEHDRKQEARAFDAMIVQRFDAADSPAIYRIIVQAAKRRLE